MKKIAVYTGTQNLYRDMENSSKSLILNSSVDEVYFLTEDDEFPLWLPPIIKTINVSGQKYYPSGGPNMSSQFTYMAMMRAAIPLIFEDDDVVLHLDVDTIVQRNCDGVWDLDVGDYYFSASHEMHRCQWGLFYTNLGVCLQNCKRLRESGKTEEIIYTLNHQRFPWVEQDVYNYLCQGRILDMPSKYNDCDFTEFVEDGQSCIKHYAGIKDWNSFSLPREFNNVSWDYILEKRGLI